MKKQNLTIKERIIKLLGGHTASEWRERWCIEQQKPIFSTCEYKLENVRATVELDEWETNALSSGGRERIIRDSLSGALMDELMQYVELDKVGVSHYGGEVYMVQLTVAVKKRGRGEL